MSSAEERRRDPRQHRGTHRRSQHVREELRGQRRRNRKPPRCRHDSGQHFRLQRRARGSPAEQSPAQGMLTIDRSTFNSKGSYFTGVRRRGHEWPGTLDLRNSTVFRQRPRKSAAASPWTIGHCDAQNDTISGNMASFLAVRISRSGGTITISNTIVVGQRAQGRQLRGTVTDGGYNLDDDGSCGFSDHAVSGDPLLGRNCAATAVRPRPARSGEGSPAIGAGNATVCQSAGIGNVDQRGEPRRAGTRGNCDIGAYDTGPVLPALPRRRSAAARPRSSPTAYPPRPSPLLPRTRAATGSGSAAQRSR